MGLFDFFKNKHKSYKGKSESINNNSSYEKPKLESIVDKIISHQYNELTNLENTSIPENNPRYYIHLCEWEIDKVDTISVDLPKENNGYSFYRTYLVTVKNKDDFDEGMEEDYISSIYLGRVCDDVKSEGKVFFGELDFAWENDYRSQEAWFDSDESVTLISKNVTTNWYSDPKNWDIFFKTKEEALFFIRKFEEELLKEYALSTGGVIAKFDNIIESPVKSIDDLNLDPETRKKLEESMVTIGNDGVLEGITANEISEFKSSQQTIDKESEFTMLKEFVKNNLDTKEEPIIEIMPYKWDTIEQQETYGDLYWEGIKYSASWDMVVKNAVFQFDLENESIEDFYNVIKAYESIDELKGDYFSLLPIEDSGGDLENIKIEWERPLNEQELEAFEQYGGKEKLADEIYFSYTNYDTIEVVIGRISSIEVVIGIHAVKIEA